MAWNQSGNIRGASGVPGASGASGLQGVSGIPGASGPVGATGPEGPVGSVGPTGPAGPVGATGPEGPVGATGGTGGVGATGAPGTTTWSGITDKPAVIAAGVDAAAARNVISAEYTGNKGVANGYAALDSSGLIPSSQLPSFVDDVIEAANLAAFPGTGESGKIYTALDTNKVYRWGGSSYTEISPSPGSTDAVPEGSTNLYYTAARADGRITAAVGSSVQAYSATLTTYAGKTAPSGAVVGTTDTQALTNKDLSGTGNTFPAFIRRSVSTITAPTTLAATANTDYVYFLSTGSDSDDASFSSVVALLSGDGANNATTMTDSSVLATNWTANGDAKLSTSVKKFGTASIALDGTGDYLSPTAASSNFAFGTSDFTIEMWIYSSSLSGERVIYEARTSEGAYPTLMTSGSSLAYYTNSGFRITGGTLSTSTWYHVALCRSGTSTKLFLDGTQVGSTYTDSTNYINGTGRPWIGSRLDSAAYFSGNIDDIRITKGVSRYTANFTAPTAAFPARTTGTPTLPTAISNSSLYTIRNITVSSITIGVTSSQLIDGATGGLALASNTTARIISDGTGWRSV